MVEVTERCTKAMELVEFARSNGWQTKIYTEADDEGTHVDVQLSSDWRDPDWQWGVILRWYFDETRKTWRLGQVNGHPVVGVAIGPDRVEREFWMNGVRRLRDHIAEPAKLIGLFTDWWSVR